MLETNICQHLEWDSDFFGFRIARVNGNRLTAKRIEAILAWCEKNYIECLYFLADSDHVETVRLAERNQFRLVDVRVTLQLELSVRPPEKRKSLREDSFIRAVEPTDITALKKIAGESNTVSRFVSDACFSEESSRALYETWIEKSCQGYADTVLVSGFSSQSEKYTAGYITCHLPTSGHEAKIGLLGIDKKYRGQGVGRILLGSALDWFADRGVEKVNVVTQGQNIAAQRLYQSCGFMTHSLRLWYHRWFAACKV